MSISTHASAEIKGIEYVNLEIEGKEYRVPVGNKERQEDLYLIKKSLRGDREAREMLLGESKERAFYIGEMTPLWLIIGKSDQTVIKGDA